MSWIKCFFNGNFKYYFAYFSIIVVFTLLIIEIILRSMTFSSGTGVGSANQRWEDKYWSPVNELGYRDFDLVLDDSRRSIILLGDSFTAGHGVKFEETFFYSIHQSLDLNYRVINLGQSGTSTIEQINNLSKLITKVKPNIDTMVIQYFGNDIDDYTKLPPLKKSLFRRGMSRVSELYSFFDAFFINKKWNQDYMESLFLSYQNQDIMRKHLNDINTLVDIVKADDAKIIFLAIPFLNNNDNLDKSKIYISQLKENFINTCEDNDYFVDVSPLAKSFEISKRVVNFMDAHASPELHLEIGVLLNRLLKNNIKESDESVYVCNS
jgi:hypothetical protein